MTGRLRKTADWRICLPLGLVTVAVLFNLVALTPQLRPAQNLNDAVVHTQMVRAAERRMAQGQLPLDGWYPYLSMGSSRFHHAQSAPHIAAASLGRLIGPEAAYRWTLYLLMATWPVSVYWGVRLMGWGRWAAAASALVSPLAVSLPGLGHEHGSYTWHGYGVWSQLWAMWVLPLAWGSSWRAVTRGTGYAAAALAVGATICFHFIAGYLALLAVGVWVLVGPSDVWPRLRRAVVVGGGALLVASWVLVPLIVDAPWTNQSPALVGTVFRDSFGASQILGWLVRGELFDRGRLPVLTILVAVGVWRCAVRFRRDERARGLLAITTLSLVLFFGRPTLGPLLELLPGSGDIFLRRLIMGVHLGGFMIAGIGIVWLGDLLGRVVRRAGPAIRPLPATGVSLGVIAVLLLPAWLERLDYDLTQGGRLVDAQGEADRSDGADAAALITEAVDRDDGRVFGGMRGRWGDTYRIGEVPMYAVLGNLDADALGFTYRTPTGPGAEDIEVMFDETDPSHFDLFNVRYQILPQDRTPFVPATLIGERGRHRLWEVAAGGYLGVVDSITPIRADRTNLGNQVRQFVSSELPARRLHPLIEYEGAEAPPPTRVAEASPEGPPGLVQDEVAAAADGVFRGTVVLRRTAVVMLRSAFDPRWEATVDGRPRPVFMIAPNYMGVVASAGLHEVVFRYEPYPVYGPLLLVGVLTLAALAGAPRWRARRRRSGTAPPPSGGRG